MNWLIRLGQWWESRRVLRKPDYKALDSKIELFGKAVDVVVKKLEEKNESLQAECYREFYSKDCATHLFAEISHAISELKNGNKLPDTLSKEFALTKARLDRLELYVGLKRDPQPVTVPDSARIK